MLNRSTRVLSIIPSAQLPLVHISAPLAQALDAQPGDLLYLSDRRWWLGGLRSAHAIVEQVIEADEPTVELGPGTFESVVARKRAHQAILVERLY